MIDLAEFETLIGVGIFAVGMMLLIMAALPAMLAFKWYTKKKWKTSFFFGLWYVGVSVLVGIAFHLLNLNLGVLMSALKIILVVFLITRVFKKFKVRSEWSLIIWIIVANVVVAVVVLLVLGAIWLPIILEAVGGAAIV